MKKALVVIAFLTFLAGFGAAGFFLGFHMQERLLAKSERNPVKLEMQIATWRWRSRPCLPRLPGYRNRSRRV
jgi:hypothetical protein